MQTEKFIGSSPGFLQPSGIPMCISSFNHTLISILPEAKGILVLFIGFGAYYFKFNFSKSPSNLGSERNRSR
jgi:hypothetical protein